MSSAQEAADEDADPAGNPDPDPAGGAPRPRRAEVVGARVRVQWPDDEDWYEAVVRAYSTATGRHNVWYPYDEQARLRALLCAVALRAVLTHAGPTWKVCPEPS